MAYPIRDGMELERLRLVWDIYSWVASSASGKLTGAGKEGHANIYYNKVREQSISWDMAQIFAAIAGGYIIELSPHFKGVQTIKRNKELWQRVAHYVKLTVGRTCLPYDTGVIGDRWEKINGINFIT